MDDGLVRMLGEWDGIPVTYAGGIGSPEDLERFEKREPGERLILRSEVHWIYLVERFPMNIAKL